MSNERHGGDRGNKRYGNAGRGSSNHRGGSGHGKGRPGKDGYRGGGRGDGYRSRDRFDDRSAERRGGDFSRGGGKYGDRRDDRGAERRGERGGDRDRNYSRRDSGSRNHSGRYRDYDRRGQGGRRYDDERRYESGRGGSGADRRDGRTLNGSDWKGRDDRRRGGDDYRGRSQHSRNERGNRRYNDRDFEGGRGRSGGRGQRPESKRGGSAPRRDFSSRPHELRAIRETHVDPEIPEEITERDLPMKARVELKTLSHENYITVARHLVMASMLIDTDPQLAHAHALSASRRGGRVAMVREALAITAYQIGDYALALRELRTYRRISGRDDEIALMVDCERGLGRPDRAIELGQSVDRSTLDTQQQVLLAIAMSGARLDLGETELARAELEIPQLDRTRAFSYSPALFRAYAAVLDDLGDSEATLWESAADRAEAALEAAQHNEFETVTIITERVETEPEDEAAALADESIESQIRAEYDELIAEVEREAAEAAAAGQETSESASAESDEAAQPEAAAKEADAETETADTAEHETVAADATEGSDSAEAELEMVTEATAEAESEAESVPAAEPEIASEPEETGPAALDAKPETEEAAAAEPEPESKSETKPAASPVIDDDQPSLFDL